MLRFILRSAPPLTIIFGTRPRNKPRLDGRQSPRASTQSRRHRQTFARCRYHRRTNRSNVLSSNINKNNTIIKKGRGDDPPRSTMGRLEGLGGERATLTTGQRTDRPAHAPPPKNIYHHIQWREQNDTSQNYFSFSSF